MSGLLRRNDSAGSGGPLATYRFDGESELAFDKLAST